MEKAYHEHRAVHADGTVAAEKLHTLWKRSLRATLPIIIDIGQDPSEDEAPSSQPAQLPGFFASMPALAMAAIGVEQLGRAMKLRLEFSPAALGDVVAKSYIQTGNIDDIDTLLNGPVRRQIQQFAALNSPHSQEVASKSCLYVASLENGFQAEWKKPAPSA